MGCTFWNSFLKYFGAQQQIINDELGQNKYWLPCKIFLMKIHFHFCTGFYSDSVSWTESPWRVEYINFPLRDIQSPNSEFLNSSRFFSVAFFPFNYNLCPKKLISVTNSLHCLHVLPYVYTWKDKSVWNGHVPLRTRHTFLF